MNSEDRLLSHDLGHSGSAKVGSRNGSGPPIHLRLNEQNHWLQWLAVDFRPCGVLFWASINHPKANLPPYAADAAAPAPMEREIPKVIGAPKVDNAPAAPFAKIKDHPPTRRRTLRVFTFFSNTS